MNPLDMTGPEFLQFYLIYGVAGLVLAGLLRIFLTHGSDSASGGQRWTPGYYPHDDEAYGIALLRGGRKEAVRTLLGRLVTSGLVALEGGVLRREPADETNLTSMERRALSALGAVHSVPEAEQRIAETLAPELNHLESDLGNQGVVPSPGQRQGLRLLLTLALLIIPGLGLAKLAVALSRGKTNIFFLLILLAVYTVAVVALLRPPRVTRAGRRYLAWLRESHQGLRNMLADGRRNDPAEALLAAGIFGLAAVPAFSMIHDQFEPRRKQDGSSDGGHGGDGGSSHSCSSGDGGGGSSCGGGGGCGGCGGGS